MFDNKKIQFNFIFGLSVITLISTISTNIHVSANSNLDLKQSAPLQKIDDTYNWVKSDNNWYCFNASKQPRTGWIVDNKFGIKYRLDSDGKMQTGWNHIEDSWYYFKLDTGEMVTGWLQDNGKWYYFNEDGTMVIDTTIDGYAINSNGELIE